MNRDAFVYGGFLWIRDGSEFCKLTQNRHSTSIKPHEYFEAYTAMKNEEGQEYARSL